jgi:dTDP-4-dehydrorhamnose reductase
MKVSPARVLILGKGFLGNRLAQTLQYSISDAWIKTVSDAQKIIKKYNPQVVVNCIGYNGRRNVDDCERALNKTLLANTTVPLVLAEACFRAKVKFVHISSGCIFRSSGDSAPAITEMVSPDFFDLYYSRTKIYSEAALAALARHHNILILRLRLPLDIVPHPHNLLTKLIGFRRVIDCPNSTTYIPDFIAAVRHLIRIDAQGIFNIVNSGALRFPELLKIYQQHQPRHQFVVVDFNELKINRVNTIMSNHKLVNSGFPVRPIHDVLEECVEKYLA